MKRKLMNLENARVPHQKTQMEEIAKRGICPFCPKYFTEYHAAPILKETKFWLVTKNDYPYEGAKIHLLFVHKNHIEDIKKISPKASQNLIELISWAQSFYKLQGSTFLMRSGDIKYTGATIAHLHGHLVCGSRQSQHAESIKLKAGFKRKNPSN